MENLIPNSFYPKHSHAKKKKVGVSEIGPPNHPRQLPLESSVAEYGQCSRVPCLVGLSQQAVKRMSMDR